MEYTQAYQFIAKPINLNDVSKEKEKVVEGKEDKRKLLQRLFPQKQQRKAI